MKLNRINFTRLSGIVLAASLMVGTSAYADGTAPGEGFYVGAFVGHGTGVIEPKVKVLDMDSAGRNGGGTTTFETDRGGLGMTGIQGGGWFGWGMKTADDLYFGLEGSMAGSDEKIKLTSSTDIAADNNSAITSATATRNWVGGASARVGYYVNSDTLFAISGGVAVSQFDVEIGSSSETYYAGGPRFGGSITTRLSKIDPNLSLRIEYLYTDYLTADINGQNGAGTSSGGGANNDSELTGSDSAGRIGLTYAFDFPSVM